MKMEVTEEWLEKKAALEDGTDPTTGRPEYIPGFVPSAADRYYSAIILNLRKQVTDLQDWQRGSLACRAVEEERVEEYRAKAEAAEAMVALLSYGHIWHTKVFSSMKMCVCTNCGFILNLHQPNKPCPGPVGVEMRDSTA